jgi:YMGG-like Gly-zipper
MKPLFLILSFLLSLGVISCTPNQKTVGTGAAAGAIIGTVIADGDNHKKGALIGAGVGAVAGAAVNKNRSRH